MDEFRELSSEKFVNIFSSARKYISEPGEWYQGEWYRENNQYYSKNDDGSSVWDYNAYIRKVKALVSQEGIQSNVELRRLLKPEIITENSSEYLVKYKICISNLIIRCRASSVKYMILRPLPISENIFGNSKLVKNQYQGGIYLCFENVMFSESEENRSDFFCIALGENARTDFKRCIFSGVDLFLSASGKNSYVYFQDSKFKNRHTTITAGTFEEEKHGYTSNDYSISPGILYKKMGAKRLTRMVNEQKNVNYTFLRTLKSISEDEGAVSIEGYLYKKINEGGLEIRDLVLYLMSLDHRIEVNQDDVRCTTEEKTVVVCFKNCEMSHACVSGRKIYFIGENKIEKISKVSNPEDVYYGPYNILDKCGVNARAHRPIFIAWKEYATKTNDRSLELILNRELLRIERHILREERTSSNIFTFLSLNDRFILWFSDKSNDFGMNWVRPVSFIFLINFVFSAILLNSLSYELDISFSGIFNAIGIYMELLLPINSVSTVLGSDSLNKGWEGLNIIKNIISSVFLYQSLVALRRYGKK